jgi:DNA-binding XRE family transcriptional regulator
MATRRINLPRRLRAWRRREGLTQKEAAERLSVNPFTYVEYESGRRGRNMSEFQYQHIIRLTAHRNSNESQAKDRRIA